MSNVSVKSKKKMKHQVTMTIYEDNSVEFDIKNPDGLAAGRMQTLLQRATRHLKTQQSNLRFANKKKEREEAAAKAEAEAKKQAEAQAKLEAEAKKLMDEFNPEKATASDLLKLQEAMKAAGISTPIEEVMKNGNENERGTGSGGEGSEGGSGETSTGNQSNAAGTEQEQSGVPKADAGQSESGTDNNTANAAGNTDGNQGVSDTAKEGN